LQSDISAHRLAKAGGEQLDLLRLRQAVVITRGGHHAIAKFTNLMVLLDSRSIHNFIDVITAERVRIKFHGSMGLRVVVANDNGLSNPGRCNDLAITIIGEPFVINCYNLALSSFDMVLGVQWLKSFGPVLWDFHRRTLAFVRNGHRVLWIVMP
jgi:hypothetical protein